VARWLSSSGPVRYPTVLRIAGMKSWVDQQWIDALGSYAQNLGNIPQGHAIAQIHGPVMGLSPFEARVSSRCCLSVEARIPHMNETHISELVSDRNDMRIKNLSNLKVMMTGHGAADLRHSITPYGRRFVAYLYEI